MPVVRVDEEVQRELLRRRLPGERSHNEPILRAIEEYELKEKMRRVGLTTPEVVRYHELLAVRGAL